MGVRACLDHYLDHAFWRKGLVGDAILPVGSLQHLEQSFVRGALHREVQVVPVVTSDFVYRDGVGMLKRGDDPVQPRKSRQESLCAWLVCSQLTAA